MIPSFKALAVGTAIAGLLLLPETASANQGLKALGEAVDFLFKIAIVVLSINLLTGLWNLHLKKTWLRVINVVLTLPFLIISLLLLAGFPMGGIIGLVIVFVQGVVIYGSYERKA